MPLKVKVELNGKVIGVSLIANVSTPYNPEAEYADYHILHESYDRSPVGNRRHWGGQTDVQRIRRKPDEIWRFLRDILNAAIPEVSDDA